MPRKRPTTKRWASFVGTREKPIELFVHEKDMSSENDDPLRKRVFAAAFKGLQQGYGFGIGVHGITPFEYAEVLQHLAPTAFDAQSELSSTPSPCGLDRAYLGLRIGGRLVRLTDENRGNKCEFLESLMLSQRHVIAEVCRTGLWPDGQLSGDDNTTSFGNLDTFTFGRYCVMLPPLAGMQDFLRLIDAPVGSVTLGSERSTLYARPQVFPSEKNSLESYCWRNTIMAANKLQTQACYVVLTLLPSMSGGLVTESIENVQVYVTVTEEIIRGHTGPKGSRGRYYEWVTPVVAGMKTKRVQTFSIATGCSLVVPSTFAIRLGSHYSQEVVFFIHTVRVKLRNEERKVFLLRGRSSIPRELQEYGNFTEVISLQFMRGQNKVELERLCGHSPNKEHGTLGTIPSIVSVPLNTRMRQKISDSFSNIRLGNGGVREAYRRTPFIKIQIPSAADLDQIVDEFGVQWMARRGTDRLYIDDVPYENFERDIRRRHLERRDSGGGNEEDDFEYSASSSASDEDDNEPSREGETNHDESTSEGSTDTE